MWWPALTAVANAHPTVLAAADQVIGSQDEDGVAAEPERLFDLDREWLR